MEDCGDLKRYLNGKIKSKEGPAEKEYTYRGVCERKEWKKP